MATDPSYNRRTFFKDSILSVAKAAQDCLILCQVPPAVNQVQQNIDRTVDPQPHGTKFDGANMFFFMRFTRGIGMHAGYLPGYPASHGCVRMPQHMAETFFRNVSVGTPVDVRD